MSAHVWRAEPHEAQTVARLLIAFRDDMGRDWPSDNAFLAAVEKLIESLDCEFLLGSSHDDAPPEGIAQIRFRQGVWMAAPDCWLEDLFVEPSARRSGLGRALVEASIDRARSRGCRRIELDVSEANAQALSLYEGLGFGAKSAPDRDLLLGLRISED